MTKAKDSRLCAAKRQDGVVCQTAALLESDFCYFHDPTKADERKQAQALGGRQHRIRTLNASTPDVTIKECGDVIALISETINQVRKGTIDPRIANSVGYLANVLIKAFEQDKLESRIEKLEALLEHRNEEL